MPSLTSFADVHQVPNVYDFETIRVSRKHSFENVGNTSHVLVPHRSLQVVGALDLKGETMTTSQLDMLAGEPTLYWTPHTITQHYADSSIETEFLRTFSYDKEEKGVEWMVMVKTLPKVFMSVFSTKVPSLWGTTFEGRFAIADSNGKVLVTCHEQWRDSDADRGVTMQYIVRDREHPMWSQALWSAFCIRPQRLHY